MATNPEPTRPTSTPSSPLAAAGLAIALYIAVIDAAVETFLRGSPVRWWVVGVVAAYLAISVGLWRYRRPLWQRMRWSARASASFFLLLGLLAFTAWLPGGLTDGIRVVGQSTSRVLSLFTIVVIVLAGVSLVRLPWLPRWAKVVAGLLAAYGLAAFLKGIVTGTEFAALLHGDSLWTRLPAWLQGAFLGALVVVPAGLLLHAVRMVKATPGVSRAWDLRQGIAMAMSVLMAVSAFRGTGAFGPQPSAAEIVQPVAKSYQELGEALAAPKPKTPPTTDQLADQVEKLFPLLEKAEREIPRDTFDMQAVIDKVGKDPQKLFEWVRDNTYFVPYRGLLRGDKGVLMDRLGNSLDRAMLLYAMLRNIGQPVRLAHGALTEDQAQNVLSKVRPFPSFDKRTGSATSAADTDASVKQYADQNQVDAAKIRKALDQITAQQQRVKELVQKRVAAQAAMIAAAVGHPPASALAEEHANQVRALTDHWWVQWQNGPSWLDLDPTLPDAQPGRMLTAVQATPAPGSYTDLGQELLHTVQIKVVIEVWKHGSITEVPVLTQELLPADLIGQSIVLRQIPVRWPQDLNLFQEKNPLERFKQTVLALTEWLPVLSVGSQNVSRYSFNDYGDLTDSTMPGYVQNVMAGRVLAHKEEEGAEALGKSIGGLLSGPRGQEQRPDQKAAAEPERTQVTAEWIDYEIQTPGHSVQKIRREVFDLLGPSVRQQGSKAVVEPQATERTKLNRGLALLGEIQILPVGCWFSRRFVEYESTLSVLANGPAVHSLLEPATSDNAKRVMDVGSTIRPVPAELYAFAAVRNSFASSQATFVDSVDIFTRHQYMRESSQGELVGIVGFDIVANRVGVRWGLTRDVFLARLEQGVLDTNLEAFLPIAAAKKIVNTSEMFTTDHVRVPWVVVRSEADLERQTRGIPTNVLARMRSDVAKGLVLICPTQLIAVDGALTVGWWQIDPSTGQTVGIGPKGWGQTATEYIVLTALAVTVVLASLCAGHAFAEKNASGLALCFSGAVLCGVGLAFILLAIFVPPTNSLTYIVELADGGTLVLAGGGAGPSLAKGAEMLLTFCALLSGIGAEPLITGGGGKEPPAPTQSDDDL